MNQKNSSWLVVRYKINERLRFETNLRNQDIEFYIPKVFINNIKSEKKNAEILFPGYGFVRFVETNLKSLKYTLGLISIIRFGEHFAIAENSIISQLKALEHSSKMKPILVNSLKKGDKVIIKSGPFKGYISEILAAPVKKRVTILISMLGSIRAINISVGNIQKNSNL